MVATATTTCCTLYRMEGGRVDWRSLGVILKKKRREREVTDHASFASSSECCESERRAAVRVCRYSLTDCRQKWPHNKILPRVQSNFWIFLNNTRHSSPIRMEESTNEHYVWEKRDASRQQDMIADDGFDQRRFLLLLGDTLHTPMIRWWRADSLCCTWISY